MTKPFTPLAIQVSVALLALASLTFGQAKPATAPTTQAATIDAEAFKHDASTTRSADLERALTASFVTISVEKTQPMTALADLAKQTGYQIKPYDTRGGARGVPVTVSATRQPFWAVFREIASKGNLNLYAWGGEEDRTIRLMPGNYGGPGVMRSPASIKGPFMSVVSNLERVNTVDMSAPDKVNREIRIQIMTFIEPKIHASQTSYQATIDNAVDDHGNAMTPPTNENAHNNMNQTRGISAFANFSLPYPTTNPGQHITRVAGHVFGKLQLQSEPTEFPDPLKMSETTRTVAGKRLTFKSLKKDNNGYALELVTYRDAMDQQEWQQSGNDRPGLHLTDSQGREYNYYNNNSNWDDKVMTRHFIFNSPGGGPGSNPAEPVKLVIDIPTSTQEVPIPFEFIDLPMP